VCGFLLCNISSHCICAAQSAVSDSSSSEISVHCKTFISDDYLRNWPLEDPVSAQIKAIIQNIHNKLPCISDYRCFVFLPYLTGCEPIKFMGRYEILGIWLTIGEVLITDPWTRVAWKSALSLPEYHQNDRAHWQDSEATSGLKLFIFKLRKNLDQARSTCSSRATCWSRHSVMLRA
jgi:hypothetical protein